MLKKHPDYFLVNKIKKVIVLPETCRVPEQKDFLANGSNASWQLFAGSNNNFYPLDGASSSNNIGRPGIRPSLITLKQPYMRIN